MEFFFVQFWNGCDDMWFTIGCPVNLLKQNHLYICFGIGFVNIKKNCTKHPDSTKYFLTLLSINRKISFQYLSNGRFNIFIDSKKNIVQAKQGRWKEHLRNLLRIFFKTLRFFLWFARVSNCWTFKGLH